MAEDYDVAVLGATAAGFVAAIALAGKGHRVVVAAAPCSPSESPLADWIPSDVVRVCAPLRSVRSGGMDAAFREVRFHSGQLDREAAYRSRATAGFFVRSQRLLGALARSARRAKVELKQFRRDVLVEPQEQAVVIRAQAAGAGEPAERGRSRSAGKGGAALRASVLLIAQDSPGEVISRLAIPARSVPTTPLTACGLDVALPRGGLPRGGGSRGGPDSALHVVGCPGGLERLGMFFAAGEVLHVRIVSLAADAPADVEGLSSLIGALRRAGLLLERLDLSAAKAAIWRPPGGVALELETHAAKRTLLVGTAGGFVSALSGQTLDGTVRSALVAAEVTDRALRSDRPQETLADFKQQWRNRLADRIRPPGASLKMLLPIVFANRAMAARFARALLYGENL